MRFVMDGVEFELTAEQVCSRLKSHVPHDIHEHWVLVDGQRWPVKQVLAIATGAEKSRFVSRTARRHLRNLGFMTSDDGKSRKVGSIKVKALGAQSASSMLPPLDRITASVSFTWRYAGQVILDSEGLPAFPPLPREPGLYRFTFDSPGTDRAAMPDTRPRSGGPAGCYTCR